MQQVLYIVSPIKTHTTALGSIPKYNAGKHRMWCLFDSYCAEENPAVNGHWSKLMWALVKEFKLPRTARLTIAVLSDYLSSRAHNKLARHTTIESQCASITHRYSSIIIIMWTPSLPWYHLKMTSEIWKPSAFLSSFSHWHVKGFSSKWIALKVDVL